jgi:hypothetical protein
MKKYFAKFIRLLNIEALIWTSGLLLLAFINTDTSHYTICPFKNLGIDFCPGCGLGRSIHYLLHLQIDKSINAHPLGIFAFAVLIRRIFELTRNSFTNKKLYLLINREYQHDQPFTTNA